MNAVEKTTKAYDSPKGRKAKATGTKIKRGRSISFTTYPRARMKALLVAAAKRDKRSVSNYILHRAMMQLAKEAKVDLVELLPKEEHDALVLKKFTYRYKKA